jgi:hypothetical protein
MKVPRRLRRRSDLQSRKQRALFVARTFFRMNSEFLTPQWLGHVVSTHWCHCARPNCCSHLRDQYGPAFAELRSVGARRARRRNEATRAVAD